MPATHSEPITIAIADDHALVRGAMARMLGAIEGFEVVGEAASGAGAIELILAKRPDVVILDLIMPGADLAHVLRAIPPVWPTRVLVLTGISESRRAAHAIRAGAKGFILKGSPPDVLIEAVHRVARGRVAIDPSVEAEVLAQLSSREDRLSAREEQVLCLVGRGLDNAEISRELDISAETVRAHLGHIMAKLEISSRMNVLVFALTQGYASVEDLRQVLDQRNSSAKSA